MTLQRVRKIIPSEKAMLAFGKQLAAHSQPGDVIYLTGELGAGKTTLVRGFLRGLGYTHFVKSPSYTLIEVYKLKAFDVVHVDLYRLAAPEEYQNIGLNDYLKKDSILLIEWPEKAEKFLPPPTLRVQIEINADKRLVNLSALAENLLPNTHKHC